MPRGRVGWEPTIREIIFRTVKSRTLGLSMLSRGQARRAADASAGPDLLAMPAVQGGGERGDDHLPPMLGGGQRVLL